MGKVRINGDTSGYVELSAPSVAGVTTLNLPSSTGTVATQSYADTSGGLQLVLPSSIAYSGGSASSSGGTTTFSGVSSISLNGVFSSTYENYRVLLNHTGSASAWLNSRLRASGTDASGANYYLQRIDSYSTTTASSRSAAQTSLPFNYYRASVPPSVTMWDIFAPALSQVTACLGTLFNNGDGGNTELFVHGVGHALATSYDGFTIYPDSGTINGTVRVYGYKGA